jgi:hypothetical protein
MDTAGTLESKSTVKGLSFPASTRKQITSRAKGDSMRLIGFLTLAGLFLLAPPSRGFEAKHDFAKWEKSIAAFEEADKKNPPPKGTILFVGSSTIVRWKSLAKDFPNHTTLNRGFGGNHICDSTYYADRMILPYEPKAIFLRAGGNDINSGKAPEQVFADFQKFVAKVHARLPQTKIFYIGLAPSVKRWPNAEKERTLNTLIAEFTKKDPRLTYIDTYSMTLGADGQPRPELFVKDQLHFNEEGYKLLAERVRPFFPE